jgi:hypothetical protein
MIITLKRWAELAAECSPRIGADMRVNYRNLPGGGSQRHAKLGKRPALKGKAASDDYIKDKQLPKRSPMQAPKKAGDK